MKRISFATEAAEELSEASDWYEQQRRGLAAELLEDVAEALGRISDQPKAFQRLTKVREDVDVRRALCSRFPYALVLAVAHTRRRPDYWLDRLDE